MTRTNSIRSLSWAPTISLSWMWGLGFFYSMHVVWTQGWLGFWVFALANAAGLAAFGCVLGSARLDPEALFRRIGPRFVSLFLLCQLGAVAITLFSLGAYLWPLLLPAADPSIGLLLSALVTAVACALAHSRALRTLRFLHIGYLVIAAGAIAVAWFMMPLAQGAAGVAETASAQSLWGLLLPTLVGFALGPWGDLQQWQRVIEIKRSGASASLAYIGGGLIFLALLASNAALSSAASAHLILAADGAYGAQASVAAAFGANGFGLGAFAFALWAVIAALSTIDSFYCATHWYLSSLLEKSLHPALAFVPPAAAGSPIWVLAVAGSAAGLMSAASLSQTAYMMPYATLLVGPTLCLIVWSLVRPVPFNTLSIYLWGLVAALVFFVGYREGLPVLAQLSPLIALIGAIPLVRSAYAGGHAVRKGDAKPSGSTAPLSHDAGASASARANSADDPGAARTYPPVANNDMAAPYGFEGQSFVMRILPTYDDTNSVGNVYFANYIRWVGKTRELFFNACMPDFDLKTTRYLVLTKTFQHDYRREIAEFEPVSVRIRIARHNRKFVTLGHEIRGARDELLGRGEQDLMFVDKETFKPLDIPADIVRGFLPFWPTSRPAPADAESAKEVRMAG